ncbi:MAG: hypothetical protein ACYSWU_21295, partial [Planctomycetota bacterium]
MNKVFLAHSFQPDDRDLVHAIERALPAGFLLVAEHVRLFSSGEWVARDVLYVDTLFFRPHTGRPQIVNEGFTVCPFVQSPNHRGAKSTYTDGGFQKGNDMP